ncbi:Mpp10 protein [Dirofilaria immitis]|nr:Mpp10 protein [Dirofilaria immitis]
MELIQLDEKDEMTNELRKRHSGKRVIGIWLSEAENSDEAVWCWRRSKHLRNVCAEFDIRTSKISMVSRRRSSRKQASEEPEDFVASSSIDVSGVGNDEHEEADGAFLLAGLFLALFVIRLQYREDSQNSPVALRTRSRSRCSSMESNDAGISFCHIPFCDSTSYALRGYPESSQYYINSKESENWLHSNFLCFNNQLRKLTTPVKPCRKRTSLMPQLEEIVEEQLKCNNENKSEKKLMEEKIETKEMSKKKGKLSENESAEGASAENVTGQIESQLEITEKSGNKSNEDQEKLSAKKHHQQRFKKITGSGFGKIPEKNQEEMLTNNSPSADDYLEQEAKLITETNLEGNNLDIWPKLDDLLSLWLRGNEHNILVNNIGKAYAFMNKADPEVPAISQELIKTDSETIWQQIAYGNKRFHRYFAKKRFLTFLLGFILLLDYIVHLLDVELSTHEEPEKKLVGSLPSVAMSKSKDERSDSTKEDSTDLFNLTEDQVKRIDKKVDDNKVCENENDDDNHSNASDSENIDVPGVSDSMPKSVGKMEEYLDKQENAQEHLDEDFFEQFDQDGGDLKDSQSDYHYADFYGNKNNNEDEKKLNKSKMITQSIEKNKRMEKRVTFADEIANDVDNESNAEESHEDGQEATVLLGQLCERISSIEQENLAPKSWDLTGEVKAIERGENTMLEKHFDFDQSAPCAPIITVDTTAQIEAKIIQRIKDKVFDDVLRTEHKPETSAAYRVPVAELETIGNEEKMNEKHEEIKKLISSLFQKLNALSHYRYIPSEIHPEIRILNNMPSLQKEEVGPLASTDAVLLAPEEIHKHVSGQFKGDDEKTKTDRSCSHRKKKKWQHITQLNKQQAELFTRTNEKLAKKPKLISQYDNKSSNMKLTSTSFFQRLQTKNNEEIKDKKRKVAEATAKKKLSTHYKLRRTITCCIKIIAPKWNCLPDVVAKCSCCAQQLHSRFLQELLLLRA